MVSNKTKTENEKYLTLKNNKITLLNNKTVCLPNNKFTTLKKEKFPGESFIKKLTNSNNNQKLVKNEW